MKNILRFAVAGALMAGYATAQAQSVPLPSSGSSDLWLFVSDAATQTTFAEDTGVSINSILSGPFTGTAGTLSTTKSASFTVDASGALTSFINASGASALTYAVLGVEFSPAGAGDSSNYVPGTNIATFSAPTSTASNAATAKMTASTSMLSVNNGFEGDVEAMVAAGYTTGGTALPIGNTGVWGTGTGGQSGSTNLYGQGPTQSGVGLGTDSTLYGVTGNNNPSKVLSYNLGTNLVLSSTGNLTVGSPVPLPAAVWLFGSGLLGLVGVGRRRAAAAV
jgi:hypothetical protein